MSGPTAPQAGFPEDLHAERAAEDRRIVDFVDRLDEMCAAATIGYRRVSSPQEIEQQPVEDANVVESDHWRLRWRTGSIPRRTTNDA